MLRILARTQLLVETLDTTLLSEEPPRSCSGWRYREQQDVDGLQTIFFRAAAFLGPSCAPLKSKRLAGSEIY
jgi:hypothetical protein